ncbi:MAG: heme exporter protein CcmD [Pseudomonadota bacterium]
MSELLHLDGYGLFVWPCYGLTVAVLIGLTVRSVWRHRALQAGVSQLETLADATRAQPPSGSSLP